MSGSSANYEDIEIFISSIVCLHYATYRCSFSKNCFCVYIFSSFFTNKSKYTNELRKSKKIASQKVNKVVFCAMMQINNNTSIAVDVHVCNQ